MAARRYHHIFDLAKCRASIGDPEMIRQFIHKMVKTVNMKILAGPLVVEGIPENPGYTAIVIVDFSHISIHTFTNTNEALIDVFSCKQYDREKALEVCKDFFCTPDSVVENNEVCWGSMDDHKHVPGSVLLEPEPGAV